MSDEAYHICTIPAGSTILTAGPLLIEWREPDGTMGIANVVERAFRTAKLPDNDDICIFGMKSS